MLMTFTAHINVVFGDNIGILIVDWLFSCCFQCSFHLRVKRIFWWLSVSDVSKLLILFLVWQLPRFQRNTRHRKISHQSYLAWPTDIKCVGQASINQVFSSQDLRRIRVINWRASWHSFLKRSTTHSDENASAGVCCLSAGTCGCRQSSSCSQAWCCSAEPEQYLRLSKEMQWNSN